MRTENPILDSSCGKLKMCVKFAMFSQILKFSQRHEPARPYFLNCPIVCVCKNK